MTRIVEDEPVVEVANDDPVANSFAASKLIETIVWAIIILALLGVGLYALHVYAGLF